MIFSDVFSAFHLDLLFFSDADMFAAMVVDAVTAVRTVKANGDVKYPISSINILKSHGKSTRESQLINGYAINCTRASQQVFFYFWCCHIYFCLRFSLFRRPDASICDERQNRTFRH